MLYSILQFIMRKSISFHYAEIQIDGHGHIPLTGPLLIGATHPNSFLDAIVIASFVQRPLHFLARSDVFHRRWSTFILRSLNLIPIYRLQEGQSQLEKNQKTFEECHQLLEQGEAILIFAEGISLIDKKIRPLKKGLPRIAFGAERKNDFKLGTNILPLGINYQKAKCFHNSLWLSFKEPIVLSKFSSDYIKHPNTAYQSLNKDVFSGLKAASIEIDEENTLEAYFAINPSRSLSRVKNYCDQVNQLENQEKQQLQKAVQKILTIKKKLKINQLNADENASLGLFLILKLTYNICYISLFPALFLSKQITENFVKLDEFYDSFRLTLNTLFSLMWIIGLTLSLMVLSHPLFVITPLILYQFGKFNHTYISMKDSKKFRSYLEASKMNKKDFIRAKRQILSIEKKNHLL